MAPILVDREILEALAAKLRELPWIVTLNVHKPFVGSSEIHEHEVPCVQILNGGQAYTAVRQRNDVIWSLTIEIILRSAEDRVVDQYEMLDRIGEIEQKIGESPKLGIPRVKGIILRGSLTDLHLIEPWYLGQIFLDIEYTKPYVGDC
jgi:hypothetical protein